MLNFKVSLGVNVKQIHYPIMFEKKNVCVHCGAEGQLTFVDGFGKETNKEIYPFDHIKCKVCGRDYSIKWEKDSDNKKMFPVATERNIKQEFLNMVDIPEVRKNGERNL